MKKYNLVLLSAVLMLAACSDDHVRPVVQQQPVVIQQPVVVQQQPQVVYVPQPIIRTQVLHQSPQVIVQKEYVVVKSTTAAPIKVNVPTAAPVVAVAAPVKAEPIKVTVPTSAPVVAVAPKVEPIKVTVPTSKPVVAPAPAPLKQNVLYMNKPKNQTLYMSKSPSTSKSTSTTKK